ncbi:MAG: DUF885 family protein [Thermoanaerobaculia bacterium]
MYTWRVVEVGARFHPETFSSLGVEAADEEVMPLGPDTAERQIAALRDLVAELRESFGGESDPAVRFDLEILLGFCERYLEHFRIEREILLPYLDLPRTVFAGIHSLLDGQAAAKRRQAAAARLRRYSGDNGAPPAATRLEAAVRARLAEPGLLPPYRKAVETDLENAGLYLDGIAELLERYGISGCERPFARLCRQLDDWVSFVRETVLPRTRRDPRLPAALYASHLRIHGVDMPERELVSRARTAVRDRQRELRDLALRLSKKASPAGDYRAVLRRLDREPSGAGSDVVALHRERLCQLRHLLRRHQVVSLPPADFLLETATAAEFARLPYPQTRFPPVLGRRTAAVEILLPASGAAELIGGNTPAASWVVAVHELGHALQFASLADDALPRARTCFATSSDREGWAVYLETEVAPHLSLAARASFTRRQLARAVRTLLEVELHRGTTTLAEAARTLRAEVACSATAAEAELRRFVLLPGHAPSYFAGDVRASELRAEIELALGRRFRRRAYHDFLLGQGSIPSVSLRRLVFGELVPAVRRPRAA